MVKKSSGKKVGLFSKFIYWEKFDFILGVVLTAILLSSFYAYLGGANFREVLKAISPIMPYIILLIIVWFCVEQAMKLMQSRKVPLLSPEKVKGMPFKNILAIGFFGNLGSISFLLIAIIITTMTMITMNPEAFNLILDVFHEGLEKP